MYMCVLVCVFDEDITSFHSIHTSDYFQKSNPVHRLSSEEAESYISVRGDASPSSTIHPIHPSTPPPPPSHPLLDLHPLFHPTHSSLVLTPPSHPTHCTLPPPHPAPPPLVCPRGSKVLGSGVSGTRDKVQAGETAAQEGGEMYVAAPGRASVYVCVCVCVCVCACA